MEQKDLGEQIISKLKELNSQIDLLIKNPKGCENVRNEFSDTSVS